MTYLTKRYIDDSLLDAIDDIRDSHKFNEDHNQVAVVYFNACPKLRVLRIVKDFECESWTVVRKEGGEVDRVRKLKSRELDDREWNGLPTVLG
jgi:hypothetical protein